jgi:hypothetical protein
MRRRGIGRPGVVNTVARTAVIAGTATAVSGRVASNQAAKAQAAAAAAPPPPMQQPPDVAPSAASAPAAGAFSDDAFEQLKKLGELRDAGILTDDEFQAKKAQILGL